MSLPSWQDESYGTMKRAGLWLVAEVGEGNVFTKAQLRDAFPDIAQIDRRMRDLRDFGWQIHTNREDRTLDAHEQRFVAQGAAVWLPGKATRPKGAAAVTANKRREVISRDGNMCRSCGITPGEFFADSDETAQLDLARRTVRRPDGTETIELVTECNRCRIGGRELSVDLEKILVGIARLGSLERRVLQDWVDDGSREFSQVETLWAEYQALPAEARAEIRASLGE